MDKLEKSKKTILARQNKEKEKILQELKKIPIIQIACERSGISRATYYRWKSENKSFAKTAEEAIREGELFINDMSEPQVITLIKEKNLSAITLWLRSHHPKYAAKLQISAQSEADDALTPEQEIVVERALKLLPYKNDEQR